MEELENEVKTSKAVKNERRGKEKYKALYEYLKAEDVMRKKNLKQVAMELI